MQGKNLEDPGSLSEASSSALELWHRGGGATEDDWCSGKAVSTRIARVDGKPLGVADLWESWKGADGDVITSFALFTVNANNHAVRSRYQQPGNENSMVTILNEGA